jgi:hypothetical protein
VFDGNDSSGKRLEKDGTKGREVFDRVGERSITCRRASKVKQSKVM